MKQKQSIEIRLKDIFKRHGYKIQFTKNSSEVYVSSTFRMYGRLDAKPFRTWMAAAESKVREFNDEDLYSIVAGLDYSDGKKY
jgi:hypothetical protein